jgi:hypothetical protein
MSVEILHSGFDGLKFTLQAEISPALRHELIEAKAYAKASNGEGEVISLKASKDREQAAFLIEAMAEERPDDLILAYRSAMEIGPRWREHLARSLKLMPDTMRILETL